MHYGIFSTKSVLYSTDIHKFKCLFALCLSTELIHHTVYMPREILIYPILSLFLWLHAQKVCNLIQSLYYMVSACLHIYQCHGYIDA